MIRVASGTLRAKASCRRVQGCLRRYHQAGLPGQRNYWDKREQGSEILLEARTLDRDGDRSLSCIEVSENVEQPHRKVSLDVAMHIARKSALSWITEYVSNHTQWQGTSLRAGVISGDMENVWEGRGKCRRVVSIIPIPREATSVAIMMGLFPPLNSARTQSRSFWALSPWIADDS
jgi:hypothetical protein